ncbi:MAG: ATP-binding cassette domain-containing protein, partial [Polaromonas sp.]|nr:ATP-binding cassette domain-containing protein [Polaromonas sp.]
QISSAFGRVQDSLSWFVDNYSSLAAWRATTDRLTSFEESFAALAQARQAQTAMNSVATSDSATGLDTQDLTVALPTGAVLLEGVSLHAEAGENVLIKGPSGSGKSTLFRALSGIWPFSRGSTRLPANTMFIPQRPYFPNGSLRDALAYPQPADSYSDAELQQALADALLPKLMHRLDDEDAWSQKLSGGEQQRLAIARVLLKKPAWLFADEATSALDEDAEKTLYERLLAQTRQAGGAIVSIAHRPTVAAFHGKRWELEKLPEGAPALYRLTETRA